MEIASPLSDSDIAACAIRIAANNLTIIVEP